MNNGIMDAMRYAKKITALLENKDKERRTVYHRTGPFLKGKTPTMHGYGYWPTIKEDKKGNVVGLLPDRAYQIIDGTFYRCAINLKNDIFIPYENGDSNTQNKFHTSTRKQRRTAERAKLKNDKRIASFKVER